MTDSPEDEYQLEVDAAAYHAELLMQADIAARRNLALAQNIATNGRWFAALVSIANIAAENYPLAILAAAPIGLAAICDQLPAGMGRLAFSLAIYLMGAAVAVASILTLGATR